MVIVLLTTLSCQPNNQSPLLTAEERQWLTMHAAELTIAPDYSYAPIEYIDEQGAFRGIAADYVSLLEKKLGCKFSILKIKEWNENVKRAKNREFAIWSAVAPTPQKREFMLFSKPYLKLMAALVVHGDKPDTITLNTLGDRSIAVVDGYFTHDYLKKAYPGLRMVPVKNAAAGLRAVAFKNVDAMLIDIATASSLIEQEGLSTLKVADILDLGYELAFASRRDWPILNRILDAGLASISPQERQEIYKRWVHYKPEGLAAHRNLIVAGLIVISLLALILGAIVLWTLSLRRMVVARTLAIEEQKSLLQSILKSAPGGIGLVVRSAFTWNNERLTEITGFSSQELSDIGMRLLYGNETDFQNAQKTQAIQLQRDGMSAQETNWQKKDGTIIDVLLCASWLDPSHEAAGITIAALDITARKAAEKALAAEKERLAITLRSIGDGVITTDTEGRIVLLNKVAEKLTGWTQAEAKGKLLSGVFRIINEKTKQPVVDPVSKVMETGQIIGLANHAALISKDGTARSIADSGAPILDKDSRIIGVVVVFRDVSNQQRLEQEVMKLKKLESVGILAGGIAHDFNNILMAVLGNLNLARQTMQPGDSALALIIEAEKASLRARDLTQQLLTFSKGGDPVKGASSIVEVIKDSADFILRGSKTSCTYQFPDDLWLVEIDKGQISQVIQNLIINASHAMPKGGTVEVSCQNVADPAAEEGHLLLAPDRKYVKIKVHDTGSGIPATIIDKVFDPYFSTKKEGSGLGLAISHGIISKHDGKIIVSSAPGQGTTFTIYLPASPLSIEPKKSALPTAPCRSLTLMVMDDDTVVRQVTKNMLEHLGHRVILAKDGAEAIRLYRQREGTEEAVDAIFMDLTIPGGMGGKEAATEILKINPKAKVIVSSGYSNDPIMANCRDYGFCAAICKPYQLAELTKAVSQITK